ncbi:MAG TPA: tetratricopeptide repeat protein, partial [Blastocatellia bacterium]|nr:tetratricopeptide repeat protein [Blastocatellia bacterium]
LEILTDLRRVRDSIEPRDQVRRRPIEILPIAARIKSKMSLRAFARSKHLKTGLIVIAIAALALWVGFHLRHGSPHQTTPDVQRFYEMGRNALSDGSYYQGSKMLERAISLDNEFPLAHARLAEAWVEMDYPDRAKDELLLATTLIPDRGALAQSDRLYLDAIAATVRRDFAAAVGNFREIAEQSSDAQKALAYVELGRAYQRNEEPQKAIESYLEAIKYDSQYAGAYLQLGILYRRQQDLPKAEESFDKAEAIYDALGNHEGVTEVLFQRGYLFNIVDRLADAQEQLKKALEKAQITANKHQLIRILLQLSSLSCTQGEAAQARLYADQAVDLAQADNTESLAANGIIDLGNSFFVKGEFAEAEKYFKQAIEFAQRSKSRRTEARGLLSLGSLLIQKNDADGGLRYTEQALAFYRQGGYSKETSQALILLARGNRQKGNYDVALQAFEQQLRLAEEIGDQAQIAYSHSSIGILLGFYQERYSEALSHFQASYEINHSLGVKVNSGYDLMNKGGLLFQVGRYQDARAALNQASAIANNTDTSYKQLLASIYLLKSRLELSEGRLAEAMKNSQQAADLAGASFKDIAIESRYTRGMALALSGKAREGKLACEEAVNMATSLGNPRLLSNGLLALAEVTLLIGDWPGASTTALQAQARFAQQGAKDSEWRAWLIAARAAAGAGDRLVANTYATQAAGALSDLQPKLGDEYYKSYLDRADIKGYRNQLDEILAANK